MNARQATLLGIGAIDIGADSGGSSGASTGAGSGVSTTSNTGKTGWDKFIELFSAAGDIFTNYKAAGSQSGGGTYVPPGPQPQRIGMGTVLVGLGVAAGVGGLAYLATRRKKK